MLTHAVAFGFGVLLLFAGQKVQSIPRSCHQTYYLLSPSVRCDEMVQQGEWDYEPLRDQLELKKSEYKASGKLAHISIYFRDLMRGPRFGIGEYEKFHPASLTKVPVLIAFLHQADGDPGILQKTLSYSGSLDTAENVEHAFESLFMIFSIEER